MPNNFNLGTAIGMWYEIHNKMKKCTHQKNLKLIFKNKSEEIRGLEKQNTTLTNSYELDESRLSTFFRKIRRLSKKCVESKIFETFIIGTILISSIVLVRKKKHCLAKC